jgi:hypothetical protein
MKCWEYAHNTTILILFIIEYLFSIKKPNWNKFENWLQAKKNSFVYEDWMDITDYVLRHLFSYHIIVKDLLYIINLKYYKDSFWTDLQLQLFTYHIRARMIKERFLKCQASLVWLGKEWFKSLITFCNVFQIKITFIVT